MKLLYSPTSPYARKVRVVAREKALLDNLSELQSLPSDRSPELLQTNPLGKVPALILDDGSALYDSPVICEYLDSLNTEALLIPASSMRWPVLRAEALADGLLDVAVAAVMERRRPAGEQSPGAIAHWLDQIRAAVAAMQGQLDAIEGPLNLGHIAIAVALSYLDLRHDDLNWRKIATAGVISWHAEFAKRRSMQETVPMA